jgi:hypothetical protein
VVKTSAHPRETHAYAGAPVPPKVESPCPTPAEMKRHNAALNIGGDKAAALPLLRKSSR